MGDVLLRVEETVLPSLAQKIMSKTGRSEPMTLPEFGTEVDKISGGGGSLEGLENGWDVMFYDENNEGLAFYSIKQGHSINPPVYDCQNWKDGNEAIVSFPYTPEADIIFYAVNNKASAQLYTYFGVDKAVYPYVFLTQNYPYPHWTCDVVFAKAVDYVSPSTSSYHNFYVKEGYATASVSRSTKLDDASETYFEDLLVAVMSIDPSTLDVQDIPSGNKSFAQYKTAFVNSDEYTHDYLINMDA